MTTYGDIKNWKADQVGAAGDDLKADLKKLEKAADTVRDEAIPDSWQGFGGLAARWRKNALVEQMDEHTEGAAKLVTAIYTAEGQVAALTTVVTDLESDARADEFSIGTDGTVTDEAKPREFGSATAAEHYTQERTAKRDALVARVANVVEQGYDIDRALLAARPDVAFDVAEEPPIAIDPEVRDQWATMTDDERRAALEQMVNEMTDDYGIDDIDVEIEDLEDQDGDGVDDDPGGDLHGYYNDGTLHLDENELDDPDLINTAAHEVRHGVQHRLVDDHNWEFPIGDDDIPLPPGITEDDVQDFDDNFDDYQEFGPGKPFEPYFNQPVERDAREAGRDYLEGLTPEELERIREESR